MQEQLVNELEKVGLSMNEAKIYLAALGLGESTAQMIAAKATVTRPTTYIAIESLIKRGLMSSFQKGKKRAFAASAPSQLQHILQVQKKEIMERERVAEELMKRLKSVGATDKPYARVFEGREGVRAAVEDMLDSDADDVIQLSVPMAENSGVPAVFGGDLKEKLFRKFKRVRVLASTFDLGEPKRRPNLEVRKFAGNNAPFTGELIVYGDKVAMTSYHDGEPTIILVQDRNMAAAIKAMFMTLWDKHK